MHDRLDRKSAPCNFMVATLLKTMWKYFILSPTEVCMMNRPEAQWLLAMRLNMYKNDTNEQKWTKSDAVLVTQEIAS